ncbi:MAG: hypothetical protein ACYC6F_14225 [Longimicrobiales bacterium]
MNLPKRRTSLALACLTAASLAACGRSDAGETSDTRVPEAGEPENSAVATPAASAARSEARPSTSATRPAARPAETPAEAAPAALVVTEGTTMVFAVDQTVSTDKHMVGDRVSATLAEPVLGADGTPILEAGTSGRWVVEESTEKNAEGQAVLAVALEAVQVDDIWLPVSATVTDLALKTDNQDSGTETAAKIGIGAAAGALAGKILGGSTEATLKGAGAGAALGTAVALATRGGSAEIKQGSTITVQLDQKLEVPPR